MKARLDSAPSETSADLESARRVLGIESRSLNALADALDERFIEAVDRLDAVTGRVVVTGIYGAREEPVPGVTGSLVVEAARHAGADADYVPCLDEASAFVADRVLSGDLVLTLGAGDITSLPDSLTRRLSDRR